MKEFEICCKHFDRLSNRELYEILRARAEVFVVEQHCVCQDMDGKDVFSHHLFCQRRDESVAGCLRVFMSPDDPDTAVIGRVVTTQRGCGLGRALLREAVRKIKNDYPAKVICLHAQQYAVGFYQKEGFVVTSEPFIEDNILHVEMRLELEAKGECNR